jgi:hypothetical protein
MHLLDRQSLAKTVDNVNACFFAGDKPTRSTCGEAMDWILTRFGAPNAYARTFGITARDERSRLHTFTGEPLTSRASLRHIQAEEACRALLLLNGVARRKLLPELEAATASLEACLERWGAQGRLAGMYCCGPCSVGLWRHLAVGGLGERAARLDDHVRVLQLHRDGDGAWRRFPYYYTLSLLAEVEGPNAQAEIEYARRGCEQRLPRLRSNTIFGARRKQVLERILAR